MGGDAGMMGAGLTASMMTEFVSAAGARRSDNANGLTGSVCSDDGVAGTESVFTGASSGN